MNPERQSRNQNRTATPKSETAAKGSGSGCGFAALGHPWSKTTVSRPAEAEELRAVRGRNGHRLVGAIVGDAGNICYPARRGDQRAGLFQRETDRVNRWLRNHYLWSGATHRK